MSADFLADADCPRIKVACVEIRTSLGRTWPTDKHESARKKSESLMVHHLPPCSVPVMCRVGRKTLTQSVLHSGCIMTILRQGGRSIMPSRPGGPWMDALGFGHHWSALTLECDSELVVRLVLSQLHCHNSVLDGISVQSAVGALCCGAANFSSDRITPRSVFTGCECLSTFSMKLHY